MKDVGSWKEIETQSNVKIAMAILGNHGQKIDVMTVLGATPPTVQLQHFAPYLESALAQRLAKLHHSQVLRGLMRAEHLQMREERIKHQSVRVVLTKELVCNVCDKKLQSAAKAAFVRLPNGSVIHYACKDKAWVV